MAKYSYEFKKKVVKAYLNGEGSTYSLARDYGIPDNKQICKWVNVYKKLGDDGLRRSRKNNKYSFDYKFSVVELYLSSELSYQELALQEGINNPAIIGKWVNDFQTAGPEALRQRKKGRKKILNKPKIDNKILDSEERIVDTSAEHVKELEDELLKLRIENAFLKELRRLRLEDEAKMRERHSLSPASEENSN